MESKHCQSCGKLIKGRADKKFCDDYCRNSFDNKQKDQSSPLMKQINNTLKKNRKLLEEIIVEPEGFGKCSKDKLLKQGFDFNYFTHVYTNKKGDTYKFCYEYGYLALEGEWFLVVRRNQEEKNKAP